MLCRVLGYRCCDFAIEKTAGADEAVAGADGVPDGADLPKQTSAPTVSALRSFEGRKDRVFRMHAISYS